MISRENIDKFNSIISHYGLDTAQVQDAGRAVCIADILYGTNDKRLSVKRLANSGVDVFRALAQGSAQPLPDVQIMRVMCDSLYYALLFKGKGIGRAGIHLTSEASDYIGKGIGKKQFVPANYGYCDMEECQKVLDLMYANCVASSQVGNVNDLLAKLAEFRGLDISSLVLDKKYETICTFPVIFKDLNEEDYRASLTDYAVSYICNRSRVVTYSIVVHSRLSKLKLEKRLNLIMNTHTRDLLNQNESVYKALSAGFALSMAKSDFNDESVYTLYKSIFM